MSLKYSDKEILDCIKSGIDYANAISKRLGITYAWLVIRLSKLEEEGKIFPYKRGRTKAYRMKGGRPLKYKKKENFKKRVAIEVKVALRNFETQRKKNERIHRLAWFICGFKNWLKHKKIKNPKGLKYLKEYFKKEICDAGNYRNYKQNGRWDE